MEPISLTTGVAFLGSGSRGNAALVHSGGRGVLVDCGLSAREARRRITEAGLDGIHIEAILVTHEHGDHISGVRVLSRTLGVPVYATPGTVRVLRDCLADVPEVIEIIAGEEIRVASFRVLPFRNSHDVTEPVGYALADECDRRIAIATDTGVLTSEALEAIAGCDLLGIEANHDADMLECGPYPVFLQQRISSDRGHLSNESAARSLERLGSDRLRTIVALHLSEHNNLPRLARTSLLAAVTTLGLGAEVLVARQREAVCCLLGEAL
ncbi:MAG: MBL fold metallo-hydrolase [Actinobacteria bacterium HGW-Actinobacteria-6]|jgi:phosphoribosyl 1,2-cyclic phosphodiesterase|nr:MAG: MBL fold metallo-hydrolase [Actinobacteria bacterium HGW-Actinobacteria-6]